VYSKCPPFALTHTRRTNTDTELTSPTCGAPCTVAENYFIGVSDYKITTKLLNGFRPRQNFDEKGNL